MSRIHQRLLKSITMSKFALGKHEILALYISEVGRLLVLISSEQGVKLVNHKIFSNLNDFFRNQWKKNEHAGKYQVCFETALRTGSEIDWLVN